MIANIHIGMNFNQKKREKKLKGEKKVSSSPYFLYIFPSLPEVTIDKKIVMYLLRNKTFTLPRTFQGYSHLMYLIQAKWLVYSFIQQLFIDLFIKCQAQFLES